MSQRMTDESLEIRIGNLLRAGVISAAVCVLFGAILYLSAHARDPVHFSTFKEPAPEFRSISGIFRGVAKVQSEAVIQLGVLLLISTPIARVVLAMVGFYLERDRLYTIVSAIVLAILLFSLSHGT
jgi:uncharacterized membrane protein